MIDEKIAQQMPLGEKMSNQKIKFNEQYEKLITEELIRQNLKAAKEVTDYRRRLWLNQWGRFIHALCFAISLSLIFGWVLGPQIFHGWFPKFQWLLSALTFAVGLTWYIRK